MSKLKYLIKTQKNIKKNIKKIGINIKKIGILFLAFSLLCLDLLNSLLMPDTNATQNSNAASNNNSQVAVLPIKEGGTNANTAVQAAQNILGNNFGNYNDGILPVAKGGTETNKSAYSGMSAMLNLQGLPFYSYARKNPWNSSNYYFKALDAYTEPACQNCVETYGQEIMVSGMGSNLNLDGLLRKVYIISYSGVNIDANNNVISPAIYGIAGPCDISSPAGFMTIDSETGHVGIYIWSNSWTGNSTLTWLSNEPDYDMSLFQPEAVQGSGITKPDGAYDLYPQCAVAETKH